MLFRPEGPRVVTVKLGMGHGVQGPCSGGGLVLGEMGEGEISQGDLFVLSVRDNMRVHLSIWMQFIE